MGEGWSFMHWGREKKVSRELSREMKNGEEFMTKLCILGTADRGFLKRSAYAIKNGGGDGRRDSVLSRPKGGIRKEGVSLKESWFGGRGDNGRNTESMHRNYDSMTINWRSRV